MRVNFVTSGFPEGFTPEFASELKRYLPKPASMAFVASDFAAHEKTERYMRHFSELFAAAEMALCDVKCVDFARSPEECADIIAEPTSCGLPAGRP